MTHLLTLVGKLRDFYHPTREPLRRHVYTTLLAIAAIAVATGFITGSVVTVVAGPLALLLAVPSVERARSRVTPDVQEVPDDAR